MPPTASPPYRPALIGIAIGTGYGLVTRLAADGGALRGLLGVMTFSFLFAVPLVIGYLTVRPHSAPSWKYRLLMPWVPVLLSVAAAWAIGWEGAICIVMGLPLLLVLASLGGVLGARSTRQSASHALGAALIPFALAPLERSIPVPATLRTVESAISIHAPAAAVWARIIEVPTIHEAERRPALFTRMGFPRPLSATLTHAGVGGVRLARFDGGVLFVETITAWRPDDLLRFTIRAATDSIPATTLDRHVVVGGPYFDVLTGTYRIEPRPGGGVILHLTSELRVSTPFNLYAGPWADAIMRSIQENILLVLRDRAESAAS